MENRNVYTLDLGEPVELARVREQYLAMGVCPVADAFPGGLLPVEVLARLPNGELRRWQGRTIQQLGERLFLVQLAQGANLAGLEGMSAKTPAKDEAEFEAEATTPETEEPDARDGDDDADVTGYESDYSDVYAQIRDLPLPEKRKLARHGNRTVRGLLMREPNKQLHVMVMQNPKVSLDEAMEYSKRPNLAAEALKIIAQNRTWLQSRQLVFNLVRNPSTPVDVAVRLLPRLTHNEWRVIAHSSSVRMPINAAARKLILQRLG